MVTIQQHDEGSHEAAAQFLDGWLPVAVRGLTMVLGHAGQSTDIHVVLSMTVDHQRRFPPKQNDLTALLDPDEENIEIPPEQQFPVEAYAHGVTALCDPSQRPPKGIPEGVSVVYLDIPTIAKLAAEYRVSEEAMLGRVSLHELSHVLRGHAHRDGKATHGYIREGDAQRDTWQVLTDLLAEPEWEYLSREARTAQVRLAAAQPGAYRQFGHSSPDTDRWNHKDPAPPATWTLRPARDLLPLSRPAVIEVPIFRSRILGSPTIGDHVYLVAHELVVGPWVVIGRAKAADVEHPKDRRAIDDRERDGRKYGGAPQSPEWLHLRAHHDLRAGTDPDVRLTVGGEFLARSIEGDDLAMLKSTVTGNAHEVLESLAARKQQGYQTGVLEEREQMRAAGKEIPPETTNPYDPYDD